MTRDLLVRVAVRRAAVALLGLFALGLLLLVAGCTHAARAEVLDAYARERARACCPCAMGEARARCRP